MLATISVIEKRRPGPLYLLTRYTPLDTTSAYFVRIHFPSVLDPIPYTNQTARSSEFLGCARMSAYGVRSGAENLTNAKANVTFVRRGPRCTARSPCGRRGGLTNGDLGSCICIVSPDALSHLPGIYLDGSEVPTTSLRPPDGMVRHRL